MSNTAICHISITLNIKFDREKDLRDTKNCQKCNFEVVWTKLWRKIVFSDSFLQNMVRPVEKIKFNSWFCSIFLHYCQICTYFWNGDWALGYACTQIWDFPKISSFSKIIRLKSSGSSWGNSYIQLLVIII